MKNRLNLTIDPQVVHRARRVARKQNTSLSALVENLLRDVVENGGDDAPVQSVPFSRRWGGRLKLARRDSGRFEHLLRKYGD